ncbi:MAG: hypothetical protein HUN05_05590 [Desulfobacter sp.]|nr:MAG: hypothetical protein HUN05_05590 [Desulfobacter sp.]
MDYIRFSDFGNIGKKPNLKAIQRPGGLLAPIREATEAVDEVSQTAKKLGHLAESLPDQVTLERKATLDQVDQILSKERKAILANASDLIKREREALVKSLSAEEANAVLQGLNQTLDRLDKSFDQMNNALATADHLILNSRETGMVFNDLILSVDRLAEKFSAQPGQDPGKPFDINDYIRAMKQFETASEKLNTLVVSLNKNTDELSISLLKQFNASAEERVNPKQRT